MFWSYCVSQSACETRYMRCEIGKGNLVTDNLRLAPDNGAASLCVHLCSLQQAGDCRQAIGSREYLFVNQ